MILSFGHSLIHSFIHLPKHRLCQGQPADPQKHAAHAYKLADKQGGATAHKHGKDDKPTEPRNTMLDAAQIVGAGLAQLGAYF